jgi:orotidine-5'-phosphate decarboxylase
MIKLPIPNNQRLIVALDVANIGAAKRLISQLGDSVHFYKIGLELCMSEDYFELIKFLGEKNKKIFADLKLYDIAATVGKAVKNLSKYNVHFLTIHTASRDIMRAAYENKGRMKILAVTVLTNLDHNDLMEMGYANMVNLEELVIKKAKLAAECKIDGVVASGFEAKKIKELNKKDFLIVTPGIRLEALENDDQKRVVDVKTAFNNGADYIVVGRPITSSNTPKAVAEKIQQQINEIFS